MHAFTITTALLAALGATASPIYNNNNNNNNNATEVDVVRRSNSCLGMTAPADDYQFVWSVYLDNDDKYNKQCGGGCLDNLRGQCGLIVDWGCTRGSDNVAHMTFYTDDFCTPYKVSKALKKCTQGTQVINCN
ncbi:uncharacterized protein BKCO1_6300011 [Diplodia corticola]|uniref:Uncharacterized protein n=1 Tax=Diplodia corticola TaxID=236234 RepID=A0A1J9RQV6_9PEZI|nr:uncharacterized protein BKCO1_6300011 [Diplodia corticola]OJD30284.1 hypothetical protein BKCO1_6300011 [Diplodia corticola]